MFNDILTYFRIKLLFFNWRWSILTRKITHYHERQYFSLKLAFYHLVCFNCAFKGESSLICNSSCFFLEEPKLLTQPRLQEPINSTGESFVITGCSFASHINLTQTDVFWIKNGITRIRTNVTQSNGIYQLSNLIYEASTYQEQGYYQCAVFTEECMSKEVRSQKIEVQFQGLHYPSRHLPA